MLKIVNVPGKLEGQIIILSNEYTASAAENFINVMKYYTNAKIIGTASYGSTGQPLTYHLESGGGFRICTRRSKALDESEFINIGFINFIFWSWKFTFFFLNNVTCLICADFFCTCIFCIY